MPAYYNENEPYAAQWLKNLIAAGHIAQGDVDERSIVDVRPEDVTGYEQCHFFAGIGGWSLALRLAGWDDDRPVWTGSCPCQPFSTAGAGKAADDERHLWPRWFPLIAERRPAIVFGEQVEAAIGWGWLDAVFADLEGQGYACGATVLPACGVGAPHIRQRCWFVADAMCATSERRAGSVSGTETALGSTRLVDGDSLNGFTDGCEARDVADAESGGFGEQRNATQPRRGGHVDGGVIIGELGDPERRGRPWRIAGLASSEGPPRGERREQADGAARPGPAGELGNASDKRRQGRITGTAEGNNDFGRREIEPDRASSVVNPASEQVGLPGRARQSRSAHWRDAEFIPCTDGKARPVEPLAQSMADGLPESLGRLRPDQIAEIEREVLNAAHSNSNAREAVHDLWLALWQEAFRQRSAGRPHGVHEPRFLLALLRQLTEQGWAFSKSVSCAREKTEEARMRGVRRDEAPACPSCGRGLDEQRSGQCPNTLHLLPSILARHAQAAWAEAFDANARATFPLASGIPGRVGRLRAYGNAIVPQVAAEFIGAFMECQP